MQRSLLMAILAVFILGGPVWAGMPAPLPENVEEVEHLGNSAILRVQTISFFLAALLLCTLVVKFIWNFLQRDFSRLPRLTFGKALAGVFLWGLLFLIVLTMISGARELMTPGAWKKQGFTYKLADQPGDPGPVVVPSSVADRRAALERLHDALGRFADEHDGRFPTRDELAKLPTDLWTVPATGNLKFTYRPGLSRDLAAVLVHEPEIDPKERLALKTNGDVVVLTSESMRSLLARQEASR